MSREVKGSEVGASSPGITPRQFKEAVLPVVEPTLGLIHVNNPFKNYQVIHQAQQAYCMTWSRTLNPQSDPFHCVALGMGPDASGTLLTFNPTRITVIDKRAPSHSEITHWLERFDSLESPHLAANGPDALLVTPSESVGLAIEERRIFGHWKTAHVHALGIARLVLADLKNNGVERDCIFTDNESGYPQLRFLWAFPGEESKERTIEFRWGELEAMEGSEYAEVLGGCDAYYQKAIPGIGQLAQSSALHKTLRFIAESIPDSALVVTGTPRPEDSSSESFFKALPDALGESFNFLEIDPAFAQFILYTSAGNRRMLQDYGWRLVAARKSGHHE